MQGVYRTVDGGLSWQEVTPPSLSPGPQIIAHFAGLQLAWLASAGLAEGDANPGPVLVYSTQDGGETWLTSKALENAGGENVNNGGRPIALTFLDDQHGWLLMNPGSGSAADALNVYRTADGGQTWTLAATSADRSSGLPRGCIQTGLAFLDPQTGWLTSSCSGGPIFLYVTQDGGETWAPGRLQPPSDSPADLFSDCRCVVFPPQFSGEGTGVLPVSILDPHPAALLYLTQDGGQSWIPYALPAITLAMSPIFSDPLNGWISDGKSLYVTQNGGQSWTWVSKVPSRMLGGLNLVTPQTGFFTDGQRLYASQDGGVTWTSWQPVGVSN
jgi:photosystem II stability/assembly factor-like uncharacterized protein